MGRFVGACTLILGMCLSALPAGAAQRVALVVGNSDYKLISPLANPANDAALMAETLRGVGFEVIEAKNADQKTIKRAIRNFGKRLRRAGPGAVGLFYYAGHGVQAGGTNYLIPLGAPVEDGADLEIEAATGEQQTPWEESSLKGDFYFTAAATPVYEIEEIDETYYVLKPANVYSGPGTSFEKVGRLSLGAEVGVTGKVLGKPWLRIALEGGEDAYVYGPLLSADKPKRPEPVAVAEKPKPAEKQVAVGVFPKAGRQAGETFKDCAECPEMVVIPPGRFRMGKLSGGGFDNQQPVHAVNIGYQFAVGRFEVTFDEWDACVAEGGCGGYRPVDEGWGRGRRPAIDVSWDDAKAYVRWLSGKTRQAYRLLSEAEWEYVARAGTTTVYNTGASISPRQARYRSNKTVRVGSYSPNAFGLYDVHGNVYEWTEDCLHDSYHGAPGNGGAWTTGDNCTERVLRGGSWSSFPRHIRSAFRDGSPADRRLNRFGFRVARTF